jgi:hypothetical protein
MTRISVYAVAATAVVLTLAFAAQTPTSRMSSGVSYSAKRPRPLPARDELVRETLSGFVRGLRYHSTPVIRSWYQPQPSGIADRAGDLREDVVGSFIERLGHGREYPVVQIANPRISWNGAQAIVDCVLIWDFQDAHGVQFHWTTKETFYLTPNGTRYLITKARTTPLVFRYAHDRPMIRRMIEDVLVDR